MLILPAVEAEESSGNGWFDSCPISIVIDHIVPWQGQSFSVSRQVVFKCLCYLYYLCLNFLVCETGW